MGWRPVSTVDAILGDLSDVSVPSPVEGDMVYRNDSGLWVPVTGTKTEGYAPVVQSDGSIAFADPSGGSGGGATNLARVTLASDAIEVAFSSISADYDDLLIEVLKIRDDRGGTYSTLQLRVGTGGTLDTGTNYAIAGHTAGNNSGDFQQNGDNLFEMGTATTRWCQGGSAASTDWSHVRILLPNYTASGDRYMFWHGGGFNTSGTDTANFSSGQGIYRGGGSNAIDILKLLPEGSNFKSGTDVILWGITR